MLHQRRAQALVVSTCMLAAAACKGPTKPGPVRVYPPDASAGKADVSVVSASVTEDAVNLTREQLQVEIAVANIGSVPLTSVIVQEGRLEAAGLDLPIALSPVAGSDTGPIAPGDTRHLMFTASVVPLGVCTSDLQNKPNPHSGLVTLGLTVVSSAGGVALSGVDVPVTCQFQPGGLMLPCATTVANACNETDMVGNLILHCSQNWGMALRDTSLCGTGAVDNHNFACPQFTYRVLVINGVERIYVYQGTGQDSAPLFAVLAPGVTGPVCLAGPADGFSSPGCDAVLGPNAGPFTGESGACVTMVDAGMPQPDAGGSSDVRSPPPEAGQDGGAGADAPADDAADAAAAMPDA